MAATTEQVRDQVSVRDLVEKAGKIVRFGPSRSEVSGVLREIATLVGAGFQVPRALDAVARNTGSARMASVLLEMLSRVESGTRVSVAMAEHPSVFDGVSVAVIDAAERSSRLSEGLDYLATLMEREAENRAKVGNALMYPAVLCTLAAAVVALITLFVVPTFTEVVTRAGGELAGTAALVSAFSEFVRSPLGVLAFAMLFTVPVVGIWVARRRDRVAFDHALGVVPVVGRLLMLRELVRASDTLRMMLSSGVSVPESLETTAKAAQNAYVQNALHSMHASVLAGGRMAQPLEQYTAIPYQLREMVAVGEECGELPTMLLHVSAVAQRELDKAVERLPALLQPLLLVGIGGVVVATFMMYFFPYFDLLTSLSHVQ